jgi:hypothetical protein
MRFLLGLTMLFFLVPLFRSVILGKDATLAMFCITYFHFVHGLHIFVSLFSSGKLMSKILYVHRWPFLWHVQMRAVFGPILMACLREGCLWAHSYGMSWGKGCLWAHSYCMSRGRLSLGPFLWHVEVKLSL